jgi:hypothetical protein
MQSGSATAPHPDSEALEKARVLITHTKHTYCSE